MQTVGIKKIEKIVKLLDGTDALGCSNRHNDNAVKYLRFIVRNTYNYEVGWIFIASPTDWPSTQ